MVLRDRQPGALVCDPRTAERLTAGLRADAARHIGVGEKSSELTAIGLLGRNTGLVLGALGVYGPSGDPRTAQPFARGSVGVDGMPAWWLLQSDRRALALVDREAAGEAWLTVERAGRPFGISCVGQEAAERYALMELEREIVEAAYVRRADALERVADAVRRLGEVGAPQGILERAADELGTSSDFERVVLGEVRGAELHPRAVWSRHDPAAAAAALEQLGRAPIRLEYPSVED